jgi:hypothetical protein
MPRKLRQYSLRGIRSLRNYARARFIGSGSADANLEQALDLTLVVKAD